MGQFSWMDCKNENRAILDGRAVNSYVLVPEEFKNTYGAHIKEECYDGYGHFGGFDVMELVALWNRNHVGVENLRTPGDPKRYAGAEWYQKAVERYKNKCERLKDWVRGASWETMEEKYGPDFLRKIGIDIACYDDQNAALEYPIKITHDEKAVYEECEPSNGDEHQGWGYYCESADKDLEHMEYWEIKQAYEKSHEYSEYSVLEEYMRDNFEEEFKQDYESEREYDE